MLTDAARLDSGRVQSLFTPNVRYLEVVEDGLQAGNVVDAEFDPTPEALAQVRDALADAPVDVHIIIAGIRKGRQAVVGDATVGVPELRPDSLYNKNSERITSAFS
jgi:hypothetical protein